MSTGSGSVALRRVDGLRRDIPGALELAGSGAATDLAPVSKIAGRAVDAVIGGEVIGKVAVRIDSAMRLMAIAPSGSFRVRTPHAVAVLPIIDGRPQSSWRSHAVPGP